MPSLEICLPEILRIPEKLLPIITEINRYPYILLEGGRVGAKTQSVGRLLLHIGEERQCRIVCGREVQNTIEESVHQLLKDLIFEYHLDYEVLEKRIEHRHSRSVFRFKGFREQGNVNIKGLEGVDILWIDEAQSISKATLDIIIPTIRKEKAKIIFTMNRFLRNDPVYVFCAGRPDCLHIKINYDENEFCPEKSKREAEECRARSEADYRHIWLGEPLDKSIDYLFNFANLDRCRTIQPYGELFKAQKVLSIDFSAAGADKNVASLLERRSMIHWELSEQREWSEPDTDITIGKSIAFNSLWQPDLMVVDKGGLGYPLWVTLSKSIPGIIGFDGAGESHYTNAANQRADGYFSLNDFVDSGWLAMRNERTISQLETIKKKYQRNGNIYIQSKEEMRNEKPPVPSPDHADSVMMAIWAIKYYLGKIQTGHGQAGSAHDTQRRNVRGDRR